MGCGSTRDTYKNWDSATNGKKTSAVLMGIITLGIWPDWVNRSSYNGYHRWSSSFRPAKPKEKAAAIIYGVLTLGIYSAIQGFRGVIWSAEGDSHKDLEAMGNILENSTQNNLAESISDNFGLSFGRSQKVSKIIYYFNKLKSKRAISKEDSKILYKSVFGVSFDQIKEAIHSNIEGNNEKLESLYEMIANKNQTSPEHIRDLVSEYMREF